VIEQGCDLPEGFSSETRHDGRVTLRRGDVVAGEFPMLTPRTAIRVWAAAYEAGHTQGNKTGREEERRHIAIEFRSLLQL
jgi:hypothetical protein